MAATETKKKSLEETLATIGEADHRQHPDFGVGDTIRVHYKIREGDKERIQAYEGTVISIRGGGSGKSFIVRRVSHEVGVERIFPYHSPAIDHIEIIRKGKVRRAKLYYLRHKSGKAGRIKEAREAQAKMVGEQKIAKQKEKAQRDAARKAEQAEKARAKAEEAAKAEAPAEA